MKKIKDSYNQYADKLLIGGLLGCKGNAYTGERILDIDKSYIFHKNQTKQFKNEKVDFLFAGIMPEIYEAIGMAKAMAETGIPYIISFMIQKNGCLIDGTVLSDAIKLIDEQVNPEPTCYMTNCIHPSNLVEALNNGNNKNNPHLNRFSGIQANASILSCEELDNCNNLQQDDFNDIIEEMLFLKDHFDLKIFGGCCGTNNEFMEDLTKKIIT